MRVKAAGAEGWQNSGADFLEIWEPQAGILRTCQGQQRDCCTCAEESQASIEELFYISFMVTSKFDLHPDFSQELRYIETLSRAFLHLSLKFPWKWAHLQVSKRYLMGRRVFSKVFVCLFVWSD